MTTEERETKKGLLVSHKEAISTPSSYKQPVSYLFLNGTVKVYLTNGISGVSLNLIHLSS